MSKGAEDRVTTRRGLRAVFAADITGFTGAMVADEAGAIGAFNEIRAIVALQMQAYEGRLFEMPGDGVFALFESAVNAVRCALETQRQLSLRAAELKHMRLRIGVHIGEVLFEKDLPSGEAVTIAARLEDLAYPGEILISAGVMDIVSARISAIFEERGAQLLKDIPRRIVAFAVMPTPERADADETRMGTPVPHRSGASIVDQQHTAQSEAANKTAMPATGKMPASDVDPAGAPTQANGAAKPNPAPAAAQPPDDIRLHADRRPPPAQPAPAPRPSDIGVAAPEAESRLSLLAESAGSPPSEECIESLIAALAVHVGPLAKILVNRMLKKASSDEHLVLLLEEQIQSNEERLLFRVRALHICMNFANRQSDNS